MGEGGQSGRVGRRIIQGGKGEGLVKVTKRGGVDRLLLEY